MLGSVFYQLMQYLSYAILRQSLLLYACISHILSRMNICRVTTWKNVKKTRQSWFHCTSMIIIQILVQNWKKSVGKPSCFCQITCWSKTEGIPAQCFTLEESLQPLTLRKPKCTIDRPNQSESNNLSTESIEKQKHNFCKGGLIYSPIKIIKDWMCC